MIVSDSSPLIALGRIDRLDIFGGLFGEIFIPTSVYQEVVVETRLNQQREAIARAIEDKIIKVVQPGVEQTYRRRLGEGEKGVLDLAIAMEAKGVILDDNKARNEARELGLTLFYTTDILRGAEVRGLIAYNEAMAALQKLLIFLPEL
jgi:predicted nucleic acid-binding protein